MTAHVLVHEPVAAQPRRRTASRDPFFLAMSGVTLLIVLSGFTPTLYMRPLFKPEPIPGYLYVHGIVLTTWFVWFFLQSLLIRSGRTALHRRFGVAGAVLVAVVPLAGLLATIRLVPRVLASGIALDSDASALGIGVSGSVVGFLSGVVWANLGAALTFAVLGWAGILLRRRTAVHKRLMLLATISILGPALARLARLAIFGGEDGPFVPMVLLALLIAVVIHDAITMKRIHPATILGAVFAIGVNVVTGLIAPTDMGLSLARWLQ